MSLEWIVIEPSVTDLDGPVNREFSTPDVDPDPGAILMLNRRRVPRRLHVEINGSVVSNGILPNSGDDWHAQVLGVNSGILQPVNILTIVGLEGEQSQIDNVVLLYHNA